MHDLCFFVVLSRLYDWWHKGPWLQEQITLV